MSKASVKQRLISMYPANPPAKPRDPSSSEHQQAPTTAARASQRVRAVTGPAPAGTESILAARPLLDCTPRAGWPPGRRNRLTPIENHVAAARCPGWLLTPTDSRAGWIRFLIPSMGLFVVVEHQVVTCAARVHGQPGMSVTAYGSSNSRPSAS